MTERSRLRKEFLHDVFTTALEGGIGYWSQAKKYHWALDDKEADESDLDGFYAILVSPEDDWEGEKRVDREVILKGIGLIRDGKLQINDELRKSIVLGDRENDAGDIDALAADAVVQAGLFGELVYG